ncbi:MAG: AAA family ATPase [Alphaproteobacteria bacterium]|nr:AAA family ATPase [Alphaproteobacteria bacterium]
MTIIREISISNFRGIHSLRWCPNPGINCLIGPGDGGKSTILDAIELVIGTKQSIAFTDADFHRCNVSEPIIIDVTLGDLDEELLNLETYGHFLRGRDASTGEFFNETSASLETVLTVRLIVREDLEPQWLLYSDGASVEGRERNIQWKRRQKIAPTRLGVVADHHMSLGPRSVLGKISTDTTQASVALAAAARQARKAFADEGCEGVDDILTASQRIANDMGILVGAVNALLDVRGVTFSGGAIALHEEDHVPMKSLGSGSMRLLVAGLQKSVGQSSISIIDELEFGLEPYRIVRLLDALGAKRNDDTQQVFLTTHSPVVLRELSSVQLHRVKTERIVTPAVMEGGVEQTPEIRSTVNHVYSLGDSEEAQATLRACAEAFLAPSVIVCEGKTEIGVLRGLDLFNQDQGKRSILAKGCHWANGGGSSMVERAKAFSRMSYRTALFMDSDVAYQPEVYTDLQTNGVSVFRWQDGLSTEEALFLSAPSAQIPQLLDIACDWKSNDSIDANIQNASDQRYNLEDCRNSFTEDMRTILGSCAKENNWYKDIDPAERVLREIIATNWTQTGTQFVQPLNELWGWIEADQQANQAPANGV